MPKKENRVEIDTDPRVSIDFHPIFFLRHLALPDVDRASATRQRNHNLQDQQQSNSAAYAKDIHQNK